MNWIAISTRPDIATILLFPRLLPRGTKSWTLRIGPACPQIPSHHLPFWSFLLLWRTNLHQILPSLYPLPQCKGLLVRHLYPPWWIPQVNLLLWHLLGKQNRKLSPRQHGTSAFQNLLNVWPHYQYMKRPYLLESYPPTPHLPKLFRIWNRGNKWMRQRHHLPQTPSGWSVHDRYCFTHCRLQRQLKMLQLVQNNNNKIP